MLLSALLPYIKRMAFCLPEKRRLKEYLLMGMVVDRELEDVEAVIGIGVDDVVFNDSTFIVDLLSSVVDGLKDMMRLVQVLQESKVKKYSFLYRLLGYIYQRLLINKK